MNGDSLLSKDLLDRLADLEAPKQPKYSEGDAYLTKILKDKQKLQKATEKRERQEELFRQRHAEDSDGADEAEETAAKKARFEESKADLQKKIQAQAGPPVFKQALFPTECASPESLLLLPAEDAVSSSCSSLLSADLDRPSMMKELLLGGWLYQHYTRRGDISSDLQCQLFQLASQSPSAEVACKAFEILAAAFGAKLKGNKLPFSGLYQQSKQQGSQCCLTDSDFVAALSSIGVHAQEITHKGKSRKQAQKEQEPADSKDPGTQGKALPGWSRADLPPRFLNLQLLLRLLTLAGKMQASDACDTLSGSGAGQLLLTLLSLQLDPACNLLGVDLEVAVEAIMEAIPSADWSRKLHDLASQVAGLGASHRGTVEIIRLLGGFGERGLVLQSHAVAHLMPRLLLVKGQQPGKAAKSRGDPEAIHPEALVRAQPWFEDGNGYNKLASHVRLGKVNIWELRSVIELVDILLWPHVKRAKENGEELTCKDFLARWHLFCQKIGNHMNKDSEGAALKLLITTIITRNNPSCV